MQWSRTKTILILILLLVDGFLIINIAGKYVSHSYRMAENAHNIVEILDSAGHHGIDPGFDLPAHTAARFADRPKPCRGGQVCGYGLSGKDAISTEQASGSTVRYERPTASTLKWRDGGVGIRYD